MSERLVLVEEQHGPTDEASCAPRAHSTVDAVSYFALGLVFVGIVFAAIGFLFPRDLTRDPNASARENEAVDIEYMKLSNALDAIIITGMVLIALGGLILAAIFTNTVVCEECKQQNNAKENRTTAASQAASQRTAASSSEATTGRDYGSMSAEAAFRE